MKNVIVICVIAIFLNSSAKAGTKFITETANHFYIEIAPKFTWCGAIAKCTQMNMELISMDSPEKTQEVHNLILTNFGCIGLLWTGGHDLNVSRHFEWISIGEAFRFTNWLTSQPNNAAHHCVYMDTSESLKWGDWNCSTTYGFVCEETPLQKMRIEEMLTTIN